MDRRAFYRALEAGEVEKDGVYRHFLLAVDRARAEAEQTAVQAVRDGFDRDWRAAAWFLERSFPGRWAKRVVTDHHADSVSITLNIGARGDDVDKPAPKSVEVVVETAAEPLIPLETVEEPSRLLQPGEVENQGNLLL